MEKHPLESQEDRWLDDGEKRFEENGCQRLEKKYLGIETPGNWHNQLIVLKEITILTVTTAANKPTARVNCSGF